jgi:mono/diheme cytochrome c family protein
MLSPATANANRRSPAIRRYRAPPIGGKVRRHYSRPTGPDAMQRLIALFAGLAAVWLVPVRADADAAAGQALARQWCANCHVIDGGGPTASVPQGPPSFHIIAGHLDPGQLHAFLSHPHGAMPDLALTRAEIDNLIAYIESLK